MKKILVFITGLLVFVSCFDKDLDLPIYSSQTEDNFFKNTDDLTAALTGVYYEQKHLWDDFSRYYRTVCEIPTDNAVKGGFNDADQKEILDLELFNVQANNGTAAEFYNCCQRLVMTANIFIKNAVRAEGGFCWKGSAAVRTGLAGHVTGPPSAAARSCSAAGG